MIQTCISAAAIPCNSMNQKQACWVNAYASTCRHDFRPPQEDQRLLYTGHGRGGGTFSMRFLLMPISARLRCNLAGVTRRWILGLFTCFLPSFSFTVAYVLTYLVTSSSLLRLKSLRILVARLGPLCRGFSSSVSPGSSASPADQHPKISRGQQATNFHRHRH